MLYIKDKNFEIILSIKKWIDFLFIFLLECRIWVLFRVRLDV